MEKDYIIGIIHIRFPQESGANVYIRYIVWSYYVKCLCFTDTPFINWDYENSSRVLYTTAEAFEKHYHPKGRLKLSIISFITE